MTRTLRVSAVLTLVALGLMVWSMLVPTPLSVMLAMTGGQALGTLAFGLYLVVVFKDYRRSVKDARAAATLGTLKPSAVVPEPPP